MEFTAEEDKASSAERIAWLRERGVKIEFPEGDADADAGSATGAAGTGPTQTVTAVRIPQNVNRPYQTITVAVSEANVTSDPFVDALKPEFTAGADDSAIDALVSGMQDMGVGRDTLLKLAKQGQVDAFPLARPVASNNYQAVSFYVDELGQAKGLERNMRAAALADFCGFKQCPLLGDVIIARHEMVFSGKLDQGGRAYKPLDFEEKELDSSAAWVKNCEAANFEFGKQTGMVSMDSDALKKQAASAGTKPTFLSVGSEGAAGTGPDAPEGDVEVGATEGLAVPGSDVDHVTWSEDAECSLEVSIDLRSVVAAHCKDKGIDGVDISSIDFHKRNVAVSIKSNSVGVGIRLPELTALFAVPLAGAIRPDECSWSFGGEKTTIELTLEKSEDLIWNRLQG